MNKLLLVLLSCAGCAGRPLNFDESDPANPIVQSAGCAASSRLCIDGCSGDWLTPPACVDERWVCPSGTSFADECPPVPPPIHPSPLAPDASFEWVESSGVVGSGKRVVITGDGDARAWSTYVPMSTQVPDFHEQLSVADVALLFAAWKGVDRSTLPHPTSSVSECSAFARVRDCATCAEAGLAYSRPAQIAPEIDHVWAWFDQHARGGISVADFNPRSYCAF